MKAKHFVFTVNKVNIKAVNLLNRYRFIIKTIMVIPLTVQTNN